MYMPLKPAHFKRYREITQLLMKFGKGEMLLPEITKAGSLSNNSRTDLSISEFLLENGSASSQQIVPMEYDSEVSLALELEKLGPAFVEFGDMISKRPDVLRLPENLKADLAHLREHYVPLTGDEIDKIIQEELGMPLVLAFKFFATATPLSISPLSQTHSAILANGQRVVVKIQRPGVARQILEDLEAFEEIVGYCDSYTKLKDQYNLKGILDDFRKTVAADLDLRQEAHNLRALKGNLKELDHILVPTPVDDYCTSRILTMNQLDGRRLIQLGRYGLSRVRRVKLADQVYRAYLKQILEDGFVDADPDVDSVLITADEKLAILDLGMVVRISVNVQEKLLQILSAIDDGRGDRVADMLLSIAEKRGDVDKGSFSREVAQIVSVHQDMAIEGSQIGKVLLKLSQIPLKYGIVLPVEFGSIGNALIKVNEIALRLDSNFDNNACMRHILAETSRRRVAKSLSPVHIFQHLSDAGRLLEALPNNLSKIVDTVATNDIRIRVHAIDEQVLIHGFQKIANRITIGLVLAALIIGAAMLMRVPSTFTIWGYPGLAILCFLAAAGCGFVLVAEILFSDLIRKD